MLVQEAVVDVQAVDEQIRRADFFSEKAQLVLVGALNDLVVDHCEVQARRCIVGAMPFLGLPMNPAAVEYGEQVGEFQGQQFTERQLEAVGGDQLRPVVPDVRAGQIALCDPVREKLSMQRLQV
jgi:hypothetical protein